MSVITFREALRQALDEGMERESKSSNQGFYECFTDQIRG